MQKRPKDYACYCITEVQNGFIIELPGQADMVALTIKDATQMVRDHFLAAAPASTGHDRD